MLLLALPAQALGTVEPVEGPEFQPSEIDDLDRTRAAVWDEYNTDSVTDLSQ